MDRVKLYVLDNDRTFLGLLKLSLEEDFEVFTTHDTDVFIDTIRQPAVLVVDMFLDNETGIQVMRQIRKKQMLCHVIYMSATASKEIVLEAYNEGWGGFFLEKDSTTFWQDLTARIWEAKGLLRDKIQAIQQAYELSKNIEEDLKRLQK